MTSYCITNYRGRKEKDPAHTRTRTHTHTRLARSDADCILMNKGYTKCSSLKYYY